LIILPDEAAKCIFAASSVQKRMHEFSSLDFVFGSNRLLSQNPGYYSSQPAHRRKVKILGMKEKLIKIKYWQIVIAVWL
jgi:hypothetical protein